MGRLSTIDDAAIFEAVGVHVAKHGSIKLADIVAATGVSVGSLYHRYSSREELLARAWADAVFAFHECIAEALDSVADNAGEEAAMATPRFCRSQPHRARLLVCCRSEEFLSDASPSTIADEIDAANKRIAQKVAAFARRHGHSLEACRLGMVAYPLGAVRLYLPDRPVPKSVDDFVAAAWRSAVELKGRS